MVSCSTANSRLAYPTFLDWEGSLRTLLSMIIATVALAGCASTEMTAEERAERQEETSVTRTDRECTGSRLCR